MPLSRRQFLLGAVGAGAAGLTAAQHPWTLLDHGRGAAGGSADKRTLVLVTLYGGNDGLDTVIPYQDGHYLGGRGALAQQPNEVLAIGDGLALHPSLKGLKALWDRKRLAIVRGVGYPEPNRSHFRSMDIWQSASPETSEVTGWIGRWLDATGSDPLRAVSIGPTLPRAFVGAKYAGAAVPSASLALPKDPKWSAAFTALASPAPDDPPLAAQVARSASDLLRTARTVDAAERSHPRAPARQSATGQGAKGGAAATGGALAEQLGLVGDLIEAGVPTKVYGVSLSGFDTHADEKQTHANLLSELDSALTSFLQRLDTSHHGDGVVVVAYSEFGRRVAANASDGTDHGTAAPVLVAGPGVKGGFYGDEPSLTALDDGDLRFTTDFRSVYATLLERVVGVDQKVALAKHMPTLKFV